MEDILCCKICTEIYQDAVVMKCCGQSLCRPCLEREKQTNCFFCRGVYKEGGYVPNLTLRAHVDKFKEAGVRLSQGAHPCDVCEEVVFESEACCGECFRCLCPVHLKLHPKICPKSNPKNYTLPENRTFLLERMSCPKHKLRRCIFCNTHGEAMCQACALGDHNLTCDLEYTGSSFHYDRGEIDSFESEKERRKVKLGVKLQILVGQEHETLEIIQKMFQELDSRARAYRESLMDKLGERLRFLGGEKARIGEAFPVGDYRGKISQEVLHYPIFWDKFEENWGHTPDLSYNNTLFVKDLTWVVREKQLAFERKFCGDIHQDNNLRYFEAEAKDFHFQIGYLQNETPPKSPFKVIDVFTRELIVTPFKIEEGPEGTAHVTCPGPQLGIFINNPERRVKMTHLVTMSSLTLKWSQGTSFTFFHLE